MKNWLLVAAWMALIFWGSTDLLSHRQTSRFIGPFLRWFKPDITDESIQTVQSFVRKTGHVTEFAILAILVSRALRSGAKNAPARWNWRVATLAFVITALYAVSDEIHQAFVPTRQGSPLDVLIDSCGAAAGLALMWLWERRNRSGKAKTVSPQAAS